MKKLLLLLSCCIFFTTVMYALPLWGGGWDKNDEKHGQKDWRNWLTVEQDKKNRQRLDDAPRSQYRKILKEIVDEAKERKEAYYKSRQR